MLTELQKLLNKSERLRKYLGEPSTMAQVAAKDIPNHGNRNDAKYRAKKTELIETEEKINRLVEQTTGHKLKKQRPRIPY